MSVDSAAASTASNSVRYENRSRTAFSPRIGMRYQVLSNLGLHVAAYTAFRAPNLAELYRKQINANGTQVTLPNPDLKAESALGREVGFEFEPLRWLGLKGTYYVADYKDFNVPTTLGTAASNPCGPPVTTCRQRLNVNRSRSEGIEASIALRPTNEVLVTGAVNYDDARQQSGLPAGDGPKPHINRVPSPKQTVRASWANQIFGTWTGIWRHEGHTTTLQGLVLEPYTVVDANVQRQLLPGFTGFLAVENVGDVKYQVNQSGTGTATILSFGTPRTLRIGMMVDR
jgi:outer membrane receptor protein involved in Fe transport